MHRKSLHEAYSFSPMTTVQVMASLLCWEAIRTLDTWACRVWNQTSQWQTNFRAFLPFSASGLHSRDKWGKSHSRVFRGAKDQSMVLPFKLERLQPLVPSYSSWFWCNPIKLGYGRWVLSVTRIDRIFIMGYTRPAWSSPWSFCSIFLHSCHNLLLVLEFTVLPLAMGHLYMLAPDILFPPIFTQLIPSSDVSLGDIAPEKPVLTFVTRPNTWWQAPRVW